MIFIKKIPEQLLSPLPYSFRIIFVTVFKMYSSFLSATIFSSSVFQMMHESKNEGDRKYFHSNNGVIIYITHPQYKKYP